MSRKNLGLIVLTVALAGLLPAWGESPVPVPEVAPLEDLVYEANDRIDELGKLLASAESFEEHKDSAITRGFGVLAVVGQAIAEHADHDDTKIQGPALRDAAKAFTPKSSLEEAQAALAQATLAQAGEAAGEAAVEYDWAKLIKMYPMMEEIEERAGSINRVVRRPRGRPDEPVHASVIAVLTLAMHADTHEVKNDADVPEWESLAEEYLRQMTGVAKAVREKDKATAGRLMVQATATCDKCHEKFRD